MWIYLSQVKMMMMVSFISAHFTCFPVKFVWLIESFLLKYMTKKIQKKKLLRGRGSLNSKLIGTKAKVKFSRMPHSKFHISEKTDEKSINVWALFTFIKTQFVEL